MSGTGQASPRIQADHIHFTASAFAPHREFWASAAQRATAGGAKNLGSARSSSERSELALALDWETAERLQSLSGGNRLVRLMCLAGAFGTVLARYLGADTVTLATPQLAAGPSASEQWALPIVLDLPQGQTPSLLLDEVRRRFKGAYSYQDFPWHSFQGAASVELSPAAALVDPNLHRGWGDDAVLPPLLVRVQEDPQLSLIASYAAPLEADEIRDLLGRAAQLVSRLGEAERPILQSDLLLDGEEAALLQWSQGRHGLIQPRTVNEMFEEAAERYAERPAVLYRGTATSYAELQLMSERLACHFAGACGVSPGDRVAISADRSAATVAAALAVMKCGAAYLPIDLAAPTERVQRVLRLAEVKLLIIDSARMDAIPDGAVGIFVLDLQLPSLTESDAHPCRARSEAAAYVMVTSGSTGEPKAVVVEHSAVTNMLNWRVHHYALQPEHVNLQLAPLWFDSSVADIFSFLAAGAALLLPEESERLSSDHLRALIGRYRPTHMMVVPSIYANLLPKLGSELASLKCITVAGESVGEGLVRAHFESCPETRLVNEYGPTENAVCSSCAELRAGDPITIGRPIDNGELYILAPDGSLAPRGFPGEICLAGAGLARGYLGEPAEAAARFQPHPFRAGSRIYMSGDVGRWMPDARVEMLGRLDDQVKLKGVRIELEEVRTAILRTGPLLDAQVVMETIEGEPSLIAAIVGAPGAQVDAEAIRSALAKALPAAFVPRFIAAVPTLPLTPNGKLDRSALSRLSREQLLEARAQVVAPATDTEHRLAEIFAGLFDVHGTVGTNQNYFALGGDSIRLIQLIAEVERRLAVTLEPQDIYANPTIAQLAELTDLRRDSLPRSDEGHAPSVPLEGAVEAEWPASAIALGMIYHAAQHPGSGIYHDQTVLRLTLPGFDRALFARAVEHVVARHPALRSAFRLAGGDAPRQVAFASVPMNIGHEERKSLSPAEEEAFIREYLDADRARPFDVSAAPLWRMQLFEFADDRVVLCFSLHHAILDGWSSAVFWQEVRTAYLALASGRAIQLPELTVSHEEVLAEHKAIEQDPAIADFWRVELQDASPLSLRQARQREAGGAGLISRQVAIPEALSGKIDRLARQLGVNRKAVFLSAFLETLSLYSFERDFVVGVVETTRPTRPGADRILGCFLNTMPYRHRVTAAPAAEGVRAVFEHLARHLRPSRLPLPLIHDAVAADRRGRVPLFELVFAYVDFHVLGDGAAKLGAAASDLSSDRSHTPLDVIISATGGEDRMIVNADSAYADPVFVERLSGLLLSVLDAIVSEPAVPLSRPSLISEDDWRLRGDSFNPPFTTVLDGWLAQAGKSPSAEALIDVDGSIWTYAELERRSRSIAACLHLDHGVSAGARVGLLLPRSASAVASILAVHLLGASYVPVDATSPEMRARAIFDDAEVDAIVTDSVSAVKLGCERPILLVDSAVESGSVASAPIEPNSECYVIYTSGSSGLPKGVVVAHRGVNNMVQAQIREFAIGEGDIVGQFASLAFDASVSELFTALCAGATLAIVPSDIKGDVDALQRFLSDRNVSVITLPPALLAMIDPQALGGLRVLVLAGEDLPPEIAARVPDSIDLINAYGPTEASVCATLWHLPAPHGEVAQVAIGTPIDNCEVMILDRAGAPLARGAIGEICISGAGLASGYTRASEEAGRFAQHPAAFGERLYRTGDLGRMDERGLIHFHGRNGNQVKLRGYRVEPEEVGELLRTQPCVIDATAFVAPSGDVLWAAAATGRRELLAAAAPAAEADDETSPGEADLRRCMKRLLPSYMVPARILVTDTLPLTRNGKVDVRALAATMAETATTPVGRAPATATALEEGLLHVWRRVLDAPDLGVEGRFFDYGGHSLKAVKLCAEIRDEFGIDVPLKLLFEHDSVRALAEVMGNASARPLPPIEPRKDGRPGPASHHQLRVLSASLAEDGGGDYSITTALRLTGDLDTKRFAEAVAAVLGRHEILRTHFSTDGEGNFVQQVADEWALADFYREATLPAGPASVAAADALVQLERGRGFDLFKGPLFRLVLASDSEEQHFVILSQHHSITDGWSLDLLVDELARSYRGAALPELGIQYSDFAAWHARLLESEWASLEQSFWLGRFKSGVPSCRLLSDGGDSGGDRADMIRRPLRAQTSSWLLGTGQVGSTPFQRGLLATYLFLYGQLGRSRLVVGSPFAARPLPELQRQVGLYANTLPLYIELSGAWSLRTAEEAVAKLTATHLDRALYPLDLLTRDLRDNGLLERGAKPFDIGFTWTGKRERPSIEGIAIDEWESPQAALKSDWWVYLAEGDDVLQMIVEYDASRFSRKRAADLAYELEALLNRLPNAGEETLDQIIAADAASPMAGAAAGRQWSALDRLVSRGSSAPRRLVGLPHRTAQIHAGVAPIWEAERPVDNPARWLEDNWEPVRRDLESCGAVLLRNSGISDAAGLKSVMEAQGTAPLEYFFRSTPRTSMSGNVYSATEYPADQTIPQHNENSYANHWPRLLWFLCVEPAPEGGETPLSDSRKVLQAIPADLREEFIERGLVYERNFHPGVDLSWHEVFQTQSREEAEKRCSEMGIGIRWGDDGFPTIDHPGPVIEIHPATGEAVWFNQAHLFHPSSLDPEIAAGLEQLTGGRLPRSVRFGDGASIPTSQLEEVRRAYRSCTTASKWRRGDLLIIDNLLTAHGRRPFRGRRAVSVAMSSMPREVSR